MFEQITVDSIIKGAAKNLVSGLREWNRMTYDAKANNEAPNKFAVELGETIKAKAWMLGEMGLKVVMNVNANGYVENITINGAAFEVITDSFADSCYR